MGKSKRYIQWKSFDSKRWRYEAYAIREIRKALAQMIRPVVSSPSLREALATTEAIQDTPMRRAYSNIYATVGAQFAFDSYRALKSGTPALELKELTENQWNGFMREWIALHGVERMNGVTETTIRRLRVALQDGITRGESIQDVSRRIVSTGSGIADMARARVIARTEIISASNVGSLKGAMDTGVAFNKEWLATMDDRTRDSHIAADGQEVDQNGTFVVGGEPLLYPGDINASPGNVINCFTGDNTVAFDSIKKSIRSRYSGEIITIQTSSGYQLSGTPNHPILTDSGFIRLGDIDKSTNIICCPINKNITGNLDVNNIPTKFEKFHNSFSIDRSRLRVRTIDVNLYGRSVDSDIDIVNIDSFLWNRIKSSKFKFVYKQLFKSTNFTKVVLFCNSLFDRYFIVERFRHTSNFVISRLYLFFSLLFTHFSPFKRFSFGLASNMNTAFNQSMSNDIPRNTKMFTNSIFTTTRLIHLGDFMNRNFSKFVPFTVSVNSKSRLIDSVVNSSNRDANNFTYLGYRFSRFVHSDKVVNIDTHNVNDINVYTLETHTGIYNVNGIISSNCRCTTLFNPL